MEAGSLPGATQCLHAGRGGLEFTRMCPTPVGTYLNFFPPTTREKERERERERERGRGYCLELNSENSESGVNSCGGLLRVISTYRSGMSI